MSEGMSEAQLTATVRSQDVIDRAIDLRNTLKLAKRMADAGDRESAADAVNHGHVYLAEAVERYEEAMAGLKAELDGS